LRGNHAAALASYRMAAEKEPDHIGLRGEVATELLALGRPSEAAALYQLCLSTEPEGIPALIGLGLLARRRGDRVAAIEHFRAAVAIDDASQGARLHRATELRDAGHFEAARAQFAALLAQHPDDLHGLMAAGMLDRAMGDTKSSLAVFRRAVALSPEDPSVLVECALEERMAGNPETSAALLARAREADPAHLAALMQSVEHALLADDPAQDLAVLRP
jgi:tetratricopeptide (TPR) repeat protein